jgi:hypothetical protein
MVNASSVVYASSIATDKLLGSYTNSFTSTNSTPGTTTTTTDTKVTNIADTTFVVGIFSIDSGTTWNAMEADINHSDSNGDISVFAQSSSGIVQVIAKNIRNSSAPAGTWTFTVQYKIMLIAKSDQGTVTPQPIGGNVYFDSRKNYQKIALDTFQTISGTNTVTTFTHNLGYIPRVRIFYETAGVMRIRGGISSSRTDITTSTVTVTMAGTIASTKLYARIYYSA